MEDANYRTALGILIRSMMTDYEGSKVANHASRLIIGGTPQVLLDVGFPALPLMIDGRVIDKAFFDHGIPKGLLEKIYSLISTPKAIYKAHLDQPGSVVVTYEIKDSNPVIIPIHPNKQKTRTEYFNVVASMYPKASTDGKSIEMRWKAEGLLLWEGKGKNAA